MPMRLTRPPQPNNLQRMLVSSAPEIVGSKRSTEMESFSSIRQTKMPNQYYPYIRRISSLSEILFAQTLVYSHVKSLEK